MDKSEKYIEMCKEAIPEYGFEGPEPTDFIALETRVGSGEFRVMSGLEFWRQLCPNLDPLTMDRQWVKLYRQDQLQEMVGKFPGVLEGFMKWYNSGVELNETYGMNSIEQLWLAFVMKEKYKKTWNGKEWIRAKNIF